MMHSEKREEVIEKGFLSKGIGWHLECLCPGCPLLFTFETDIFLALVVLL
jgi:hypothetical protein